MCQFYPRRLPCCVLLAPSGAQQVRWRVPPRNRPSNIESRLHWRDGYDFDAGPAAPLVPDLDVFQYDARDPCRLSREIHMRAINKYTPSALPHKNSAPTNFLKTK